jgi:hypothetical protein
MRSFAIALLVLLFSFPAAAQDPTKVDPQHYKVIFEDTSIRVLRLTYGPHEKSVMHEHPFGSCVIFMEFHASAQTPTETLPGRSCTWRVACDAYRRGTFHHLPENTSDTAFQVILIERKSAQVAFVSNP